MHELVGEDYTEKKVAKECDKVGKHLYMRPGSGMSTKDIPKSLTPKDKDSLQVVFSMGGEGTRLRHITKDKYSKHMIDAGGMPLSWHVINLWAKSGFSDMSLLIDDTHRGDSIRNYYNDGKAIGAKIKYSIEHMKLSSGGALRFALGNGVIDKPIVNHFPDDIVIGYPEFADDFAKVVIAAFDHGFECVVVCAPGKLYPYGVVRDEKGVVVDFVEKPFIELDTNTGIFALSKEAFPRIMSLKQDTDLKIERTVLKDIAVEGKMLKVILPTEFWIPINDEPNLNKFMECAKGKE